LRHSRPALRHGCIGERELVLHPAYAEYQRATPLALRAAQVGEPKALGRDCG
jgi:hypothetical protein